jgi:hypothetical protein
VVRARTSAARANSRNSQCIAVILIRGGRTV